MPRSATPARWSGRLAGILQGSAQLRGTDFEYADLAESPGLVRSVVAVQVPRAVSMRADLATIFVGGGDLAEPDADADALADQLEGGVAELRQNHCDVLLATSIDPRFGFRRGRLRQRAAEFNAHLWSIARTHNALILDLWSARELQSRSVWGADRVHLSPEGHGVIAGRAAHALGVPYFESRRRPATIDFGHGFSADLLVWIDCEMTGLDLAIDELVEVAVVITDYDLMPVDPGFSIVIKPDQAASDNMNEFVATCTPRAGLLEEMPERRDARRRRVRGQRVHPPLRADRETAPLAGNTIGTDRAFLAKYMPRVDAHLHYRRIDVSSIKELSRRWFPRVYFNAPDQERRAPRARRHPRVDPRARLLPHGGVRGRARPDDRTRCRPVVAHDRADLAVVVAARCNTLVWLPTSASAAAMVVVAQLAERWLVEPDVAGSSPVDHPK